MDGRGKHKEKSEREWEGGETLKNHHRVEMRERRKKKKRKKNQVRERCEKEVMHG